MQISDFHYELPETLIARYPPPERRASRLLSLPRGGEPLLRDGRFPEIADFLRAGDLLVLNETRVVRARMAGRKESGGAVEVFLERVMDGRRLLVQIRAGRKPATGSALVLSDEKGEVRLRVLRRRGDFFEVGLPLPAEGLLERFGRVPLPVYLQREAEPLDEARYQTVYARRRGAVAAPTAGLHFDEALLSDLRDGGVDIGKLCLHIGAGTFSPVREDDLTRHKMHAEYFEVDENLCEQIAKCRGGGGKVFAVGTTVVRALESAARDGVPRPAKGDTRLFIYPGHRFSAVDGLLTNFHLPRSTLLPLVAAFAGRERVLSAYRHAVERKYRFFSYGDAMLVLPEGRPNEV